jgi:hypothetical protein
MKFRRDFVTNSSSSSYVCEICGCEDSGYDCCASDLGFIECEHGHTICEEHILNRDEYEKTKDNTGYWEEELPEQFCPICQFIEISNDELEHYKNALIGKSNKELKEQIHKQFKNKKEFDKFIEGYK